MRLLKAIGTGLMLLIAVSLHAVFLVADAIDDKLQNWSDWN